MIKQSIEEKKMLILKETNWGKDYTIFKLEPEIEGVEYPIRHKNIPNNIWEFYFQNNLKNITEKHLTFQETIDVVGKINWLFKKAKDQDYRIFALDFKTTYLDEQNNPKIFQYYPMYHENDAPNSYKNIQGIVRVKTENKDFKNSFILAELMARLLFGKYYYFKSISDKKTFIKEKLINLNKHDYQEWFDKAMSNELTEEESLRMLQECSERDKMRKKINLQTDKIAYTTRTYEGTEKLKPEDDFKEEIQINQDSYFRGIKGDLSIFVVMDGVSTAKIGNGNIASRITKDEVKKNWKKLSKNPTDSQIREIIDSIIHNATKRIVNYANKINSKEKTGLMASTIAGVILNNNQAHVFSAGDSNILLFNNDRTLRLNPHQNQINKNLLSGKYDPKNKSSALTEYIGKSKYEDRKFKMEKVNYYYTKINLLNGEKLLISSDGVIDYWNGIDQDEREKNLIEATEENLEKMKSIKAVSQRIISTLDFNSCKDNVTLHLAKPIYKQGGRA